MKWILVGVVVIIILAIILMVSRLNKTKPLIEVLADLENINRLNLQPGEYVKMIPHGTRREVTVYTTQAENADKLGVINNGFVYRNVVKGNIEAKIHSVTGTAILLEIVRV